jgi:uncharacterized membrane protein
VPRDAAAFQPYDLVVVPNAPADSFDPVQLQAMHDAIYNFGVGFVMLGGPRTFGPGGYKGTVIEDALPVAMDVPQKKMLPSGALLIALDRSGSMSMEVGGRTKIELADRSAVMAMRALNAQDSFGLLAVDTEAHTIVPMGPQKDRAAAAKKILEVNAGGGGIYVYTALLKAGLELSKTDAAIKHLILFADAADAEQQTASGADIGPTGETTSLDLAAQMASVKMTVTVVALGREADKDTAFLRELAARGRGRFFITDNAMDLPQIFIKEAVTLKKLMLQERTFVPEVVFPSPLLKGIDTVPPLHGYVLTSSKPRSNVIFQAPPQAEAAAVGDAPDPVLSLWHYGIGTTAAWTSDFSPSWARDWMAWGKYEAFLQQLVTEVARVEAKNDLTLTTLAAGSQGIIQVEDFAPGERLMEMRAKVFGPRNESREITLRQVAAKRYEAQFPLWGRGRYQVAVAGIEPGGGKKAEQGTAGFAVSYSPEYLRFRSDPLLLQQIAERTGGRVLTANDATLFHPARQVRESSKPVFDWFLIALVCLIPLDVGLRRIQMDWATIRDFFFRRKTASSGETMGALLQRKQQVKSTLDAERAERPAPVILPQRSVAKPAPPAPAASTPEPIKTDDPQSTTERLLARKRKRENPEDEQVS